MVSWDTHRNKSLLQDLFYDQIYTYSLLCCYLDSRRLNGGLAQLILDAVYYVRAKKASQREPRLPVSILTGILGRRGEKWCRGRDAARWWEQKEAMPRRPS